MKKADKYWDSVYARTKKKAPEPLKKLLNGLFEVDSNKRFSLEEVKNSEWLKDFDTFEHEYNYKDNIRDYMRS